MHQEALTKDGLKLFPKLKHFSDFYLAGGTALALQIGHRISYDFDLFSQKDISKQFLAEAKGVFFGNKISPLVNNTEELTILIGGVKITFLKYPFPVLNQFVEFNGFNLLDIPELSAIKAYTIGRRGSFKDYVDLYFILAGGYMNLKAIIDLAEKKYGQEFNSRLFLEQLLYLDDVEETNLVFLKNSVNKKQIEKYIIEQVKKINL